MKKSASQFLVLIAVLLIVMAGFAQRRHSQQASHGQPGVFDYYLLTLSWSPEFCHSHADKPECQSGHHGFVVHGLWPQYSNGYPEHCSNAPGLRNPGEMADIMQATLDGLRSAIGSAIPCGAKPIPKETVKEQPKDPPKEIVKEHPKDPPKEIVKEHPKDPPKEVAKELPKDPPKEFAKDPPKDPPKEIAKDLPKDPPKETVKEHPKELAKDHPKDLLKEIIKEHPKELHKDLAKDPAFDPKSLISDLPPKSVFDPPKSFMEPPDLPFGGGSFPFVLATGAGAGAGAASGRQQTSAVANAYLQLLGHYARLYAAGQLDASGIAAWQEAASAYQRIIGGS